MIKARIVKPRGFTCCPDGHTPKTFALGDIVTGRVAEWAVAEMAAQRLYDDPRTDTQAMAAAPEIKTPAPAPETKEKEPAKARKKPGRPRKKKAE